jgi:hypothetical protein
LCLALPDDGRSSHQVDHRERSARRCCRRCGRVLRTRLRASAGTRKGRLDRSARPAHCGRVSALARWLLGLGIAATLAANVAHRLGHGLIGAAVAAWPAIALVGPYELLMMVIRSSQVSARDTSDRKDETDPLKEQAAEVFAEQLAADRVPSVREIRAQLHVGQPRAQRVRKYLAAHWPRQVSSTTTLRTRD